MDAKQRDYVEKLLDKAVAVVDPVQAMNFTQAACNAANALRVLAEIDRAGQPQQG